MKLDLVDHGLDPGLADDPLEVVDVEVGHPDRPDAPLVLQLDQRLPRLDILVLPRHRPVDQEHVDPVEPELLHRVVERLQRLVAHMRAVAELRGDEEILARHACALDGLPDALFVVVALGGIDRAIARLDPVLTTRAVMSSGTCQTPSPSCGICCRR